MIDLLNKLINFKSVEGNPGLLIWNKLFLIPRERIFVGVKKKVFFDSKKKIIIDIKYRFSRFSHRDFPEQEKLFQMLKTKIDESVKL